ncbi:MAG: hypothetical protein H0T63_06660 [Pyrinomonadaceae bacterium]|nr:hypothetical protein [Pyrinomonadaceae bacterium]
MKLFLALAIVLLGMALPLKSLVTAQEQSTPSSPLPKPDVRLAVILEKLGEKAQQYRENQTLLLKTWRTKQQHFKTDLTTPKGKPKEYTGQSLVIRRPLPDQPAASGLFMIGRWEETKAEQAAQRPDHSLKEAKAYPLVSEVDFLLAKEQANYQFSYGGQEDVRGRTAHVINFVPVKYEAPQIVKENGKKRFSAAPRKGRIFVDAESYDVLQIARTLIENYQLHLDGGFERKGIFFVTRPSVDLRWERWDSTLRFKKYSFPNAEQGLWLPESHETFWFVRGAREPVYRNYVSFAYKHFHADVKVIDGIEIMNEKQDEKESP